MSSLNFDYEFNFTNGIFEQSIYDNCNIQDPIGDRQQIIENKVLEIIAIFNNLPNLNKFSTFVNHDSTRYKITLNNIR
jgi:hypothetical protein